MLETTTVMVEKADLQKLIQRIDTIQAEFNQLRTVQSLRTRVDTLANNGLLESSAVCKIMNWSVRTLYRRIKSGAIPVIKDGNARYVITVPDFIKWYNEQYR